QRTHIRRAVAARNPKLHNVRRYRRGVRFGTGARVRSLPHRACGTKSICSDRHRIKGEKTCRFFSEGDMASFGQLSLRLFSAARLEISSRSLTGKRNGKGPCKKRKRKARSSWAFRRGPNRGKRW